jgi:hypothetical protein
VSIDTIGVTEGNSGATPATFTLALSGPSGRVVTVNYATSDTTATAGVDYTAASGTVTFLPGDTTKSVVVQVRGDRARENDEAFRVTLSGAVNAVVDQSVGICTIQDDDSLPGLTVSDSTVREGDSGTTDAVFTVSLSDSSGLPVSVDYATTNGTAVAGSDYVAVSGTLNFAPGETSKLVTVRVNGDRLVESDESFTVQLSNATGATIAQATATGTITNDDVVRPTLSINDVTVTEGNSGTTDAVFTVTLSQTSAQSVQVSYQTNAGTATAGKDFVSKSGTLTFAAGQTSQSISIQIVGDLASESAETFTVTLSGADNADIADDTGVGTIIDNDLACTRSTPKFSAKQISKTTSVRMTGTPGVKSPCTVTRETWQAAGQTLTGHQVTINFGQKGRFDVTYTVTDNKGVDKSTRTTIIVK